MMRRGGGGRASPEPRAWNKRGHKRKTEEALFQRLHHVAYRCSDAAATVDFHSNVIGLKFAHAISRDRVPSMQAFSPHPHIFFELAEGSTLAFFALANAPPALKDPNTADRVRHLALEVADDATLLEGKRRLTERGIDVVGPTDHGFCKSIWFFDPSLHRMEMTARTETSGGGERFAREAPAILATWEERPRSGALAG